MLKENRQDKFIVDKKYSGRWEIAISANFDSNVWSVNVDCRNIDWQESVYSFSYIWSDNGFKLLLDTSDYSNYNVAEQLDLLTKVNVVLQEKNYID